MDSSLFCSRSIRSTTDPYKRAVYCLLAACDPNDEHSEVATSLDDYLWIKLYQIRDKTDSADVLTLSNFQRQMSEDFGETHFNAYEQPLLYFQVLFLTGQFELAFDFLYRIDRLRAHSVHMCLAMYESGLLLLPNTIQAPLISQVNQKYSLNCWLPDLFFVLDLGLHGQEDQRGEVGPAVRPQVRGHRPQGGPELLLLLEEPQENRRRQDVGRQPVHVVRERAGVGVERVRLAPRASDRRRLQDTRTGGQVPRRVQRQRAAHHRARRRRLRVQGHV